MSKFEIIIDPNHENEARFFLPTGEVTLYAQSMERAKQGIEKLKANGQLEAWGILSEEIQL